MRRADLLLSLGHSDNQYILNTSNALSKGENIYQIAVSNLQPFLEDPFKWVRASRPL